MDTPLIDNVKIDFLSNVPLFSSLTKEELDQITSRVDMQEFSRNETIFSEEDANNFMYIILVGAVKVVQHTEDGRELILAIHEKDDFFGEVALIDNKATPASVVATEDSLLAIVARKDFYPLLYSQPKVLDKLLQILCARFRDSWRRILILNFKRAPERIKMLFLSLSYEKSTRTDKGMLLDLKLTHQEIADMASLNRETVTRVLNKWQKRGEITVLKNKLILLSDKFLRDDLNRFQQR